MSLLHNDDTVPQDAVTYHFREFSESAPTPARSGEYQEYTLIQLDDSHMDAVHSGDDGNGGDSDFSDGTGHDEQMSHERIANERGQQEIEAARQSAQQMVRQLEEDALQQKNLLLEEAAEEAEAIRLGAREAGYKSGYDDGYFEGKTQSIFEHEAELKIQRQHILEELRGAVERIEDEKDSVIQEHMDKLRDLAIAVAEKVINISLKSSGDVIKKMLEVATEKIKDKQWAKIYISGEDAELVLEGDTDVLEAVRHISDQVKVEILDNNPSGTCIVEFPDQIIDASVNTQVDNIKHILSTN